MNFAKLLISVALMVSTSLQAVELKLVVKERFGRPAQERPFPDIAGFTLTPSPVGGAPHPSTSCPGATDRKGEVTCTVDCRASSTGTMRLYVHGPRPEASPTLKGYVDPDPQAIQLERCLLRPNRPVVVLYRTPESYYSESLMMFPAVFEAVGLKERSWHPNQRVAVTPFATAATELELLARRDPMNVEGVERLSKIAAMYKRLPNDQKNLEVARVIGEYQYGAASIVLRAIAVSGSVSPALVKVSPAQEDYYRSVSNLEAQLQSRPVLSSTQLKLYEDLKTFRQSPSTGGMITVDSVIRSRVQ